MANNYREFVGQIRDVTEQEKTWLEAQADPNTEVRAWSLADPDYPDEVGFSLTSCRNGADTAWVVCIQCEESGIVENVGEFVQAFLKRFRPDQCWCMTWADWCSKPLPDEFAGGGLFVTSKRVKICSAWEWLDGEVRRWTRRRGAS